MEDKFMLSKKKKIVVISVSSVFLLFLFFSFILFRVIRRWGSRGLFSVSEITVYILLSVIVIIYTLFIYFVKMKSKLTKKIFLILYWVMTVGLFLLSSYWARLMSAFEGY
ncbi:MAG: hypothetical protein LBV58_01920 [Acholeplasmatales bacterium]|jgi:hypothetical protein|nr:hypothetical protein [Acholeplasmatales bacterium]